MISMLLTHDLHYVDGYILASERGHSRPLYKHQDITISMHMRTLFPKSYAFRVLGDHCEFLI